MVNREGRGTTDATGSGKSFLKCPEGSSADIGGKASQASGAAAAKDRS